MDAKTKILVDELQNDPNTRNYAGMTDAEAADDMNTQTEIRNLGSLSGDAVFNAADATEYNGLTAEQRNEYLALCARDTIDPFGAANVQVITGAFGGGSATVAALAALRQETVTRGVAIGYGVVKEARVKEARRYVV